MSEISFSLFKRLPCQNYPAIKDRKSVRIWNHFPTWIEISEKEKTCNYFIWTRRPIYNCSRISRASRASLIPINRPLTFEEKIHTSFEEESKATSRRRFFLVFIFFLPLFIFCMYIILAYISCN
jgi:hypothetical protein